MMIGNWRGFGLSIVLIGGLAAPSWAGVADLMPRIHKIPRLTYARDLRTGGFYHAPAIPTGHYAKDHLGKAAGMIHGGLGHMAGALHGHGGSGLGGHGLGGRNGLPAGHVYEDPSHGHGLGLGHGGLGNGLGLGLGHGRGLGLGHGRGGKGLGGLFGGHGGGDGLGHGHSGVHGSAQHDPSGHAHGSAQSHGQGRGHDGHGRGLGLGHGLKGLFDGAGHASTGVCSGCGDPGCPDCHGGLLGGHGTGAPCASCGGTGCHDCGGTGLGHHANGLLSRLRGLHPSNRVDYFTGPGGPVPITPGYVPYIVPTRSPRDYFAFPPFLDRAMD